MQHVLENPIATYYDQIRVRAQQFGRQAADSSAFNPWDLPELDKSMATFYEASEIGWESIELGKTEALLLDMSRFERTLTTKTNPSLLMVARAIAHTRNTNEPITIVTPSSGNKATALRSAVERAYELGLATPDSLNIVCVVPSAALPKMWESELSRDAMMRRTNPIVVVETETRVSVKQLVQDTRSLLSKSVRGRRLWYTLALENYVLADQLRAFVEIDYFPTTVTRWHAHSVSSAFGLIGHSRGWGYADSGSLPHPGYLLVQHLDTPDMVLHLTRGTFDRNKLPHYENIESNEVRQHESLHFPNTASSSSECIDTTFYTAKPLTQAEMEGYISSFGGDGIVVSRAECVDNYKAAAEILSPAGVRLPSNPSDLREWSLLMALTGVRQATERGLLAGVESVVVHNSGSYSTADYVPVPPSCVTQIGQDSADDLAEIISSSTKEMTHA